MSFSNAAETAVLNQIFKGTALPWNSNTNLWLALHTADPAEAGTAITSEATYTGYARIPIARSTGFDVTGAVVSNVALAQFPLCTGGVNTVTHVSIVDTASGAGNIIVSGTLNASYLVQNGYQPQFNAGVLSFTLD